MNAIKSSLVEGYKSLYQIEQTAYSWNTAPLPSWGAILSTEDSTALARPLIDVEIFEALHSMKPFKAPSPDGLYAVFFQKFWEVVGTLVKHAIHDIFSSGIMPMDLNQTLITLIPKQKDPETFNHYRPISLCNTVYKIVTKILVLKIKPFLPTLVSPLQTAFVTGRRGLDNVVIAQ